MKNKQQLWAFCLALVFLAIPFAGLAVSPARFPEKTTQINDYADILSPQTITQLQQYAQELNNKSDLEFWLVTLHFLDGLEVQAYAKALFTHWALPPQAFLLVLSAGEDSFASFGGEEAAALLPVQTQQRLLSSHLEGPYQSFQYDLAVSNYIGGLSAYLEKQLSLNLSTVEYQPPTATANPVEKEALLWRHAEDYLNTFSNKKEEKATSEPSKTNWGQLFFLVVLMLLIFGNRKQKSMAASASCLGCGCGPLGWLVALLGLGKFFNKPSAPPDDHIYQ